MDKDTLVRNAVIKALGDAIEGKCSGDKGICFVVRNAIMSLNLNGKLPFLTCINYTNIYMPKIYGLFETWEKYSGNVFFPIEGRFISESWSNRWTGKYAERRRDLAIHIINALSRE